MGDVLYI